MHIYPNTEHFSMPLSDVWVWQVVCGHPKCAAAKSGWLKLRANFVRGDREWNEYGCDAMQIEQNT